MLSSIGDDEEGFRRLSEALHQIDRSWSTAGSPPTVSKAAMPEGDRRKPVGIGEQEKQEEQEEQEARSAVTGPEAPREMAGSADGPAEHARSSFPEAVMTIRKAQDSAQERILFAEAAGRVSGEYLYLYPPGIPLITPDYAGRADTGRSSCACPGSDGGRVRGGRSGRPQPELDLVCGSAGGGRKAGKAVTFMKHLFYLCGKSASGKDTIYEELLKDESLQLRPLVPYTTRPIRAGEMEGQEYHFTDRETLRRLEKAGKVIEERTYETVCGLWTYFTVDDGILEGDTDVIGIGTLQSYVRLRDYFGEKQVIPLYIQVDDGLRLERALKRERKPGNRRYEEMCRRFLADQADFSEENLRRAGIGRRFQNDEDRSICIAEIAAYIRSYQAEG